MVGGYRGQDDGNMVSCLVCKSTKPDVVDRHVKQLEGRNKWNEVFSAHSTSQYHNSNLKSVGVQAWLNVDVIATTYLFPSLWKSPIWKPWSRILSVFVSPSLTHVTVRLFFTSGRMKATNFGTAWRIAVMWSESWRFFEQSWRNQRRYCSHHQVHLQPLSDLHYNIVQQQQRLQEIHEYQGLGDTSSPFIH